MTILAAGARFNFRPMAAIPGTENWRYLDHAVARWVMAHGGSPLLAEVAGWASHAEGQGDSVLALTGDAAGRHGQRLLGEHELALLKAEPMVTAIETAAPEAIEQAFVLECGNFYLRRNYLHETAVASQLQRRRSEVVAIELPMTDADLDILFDGPSGIEVQPQREAVRRVLGRRLFVLTGGPGTGKTTTVLRMLLALAREHAARHGRPPVIRTSAPTGKAAQRLADSLRQGGAKFRDGEQCSPEEWTRHLDVVLGAESGTLHRLLGSRGHHGGFSHHADNRLPADIVVVDEASMVDLAMLRALLDALRQDAVLVLVGDADQLTSVGTGSVLLDIVGAIEAGNGRDLVRLQHCFRADTALMPVNEAIRLGDRTSFERAWQAAGERAVRHDVATPGELSRRLESWCHDLQASLKAGGAFEAIDDGDADAIRRVLAALRQQQLLCARREGEFGAEVVNEVIERRLRTGLAGREHDTWYPGRAVMITRNDYAFDLFNGDVGLCLMDGQGRLQVWFEGSPEADELSLRSFSPGSLPQHQGAFAATVHKSQGSEYGRVAVLLPPDRDNAVLSRQLLYTAMSRARSSVELWASDEVLAATLTVTAGRSAGLRQRLERAYRRED